MRLPQQPEASSQQAAASQQPAGSHQQPAASRQQIAASSRQPEGMGAGIVLTHKKLINPWPKIVVGSGGGFGARAVAKKARLNWQCPAGRCGGTAGWARVLSPVSCFALQPASYLGIELSGQQASELFGQQAITHNSYCHS